VIKYKRSAGVNYVVGASAQTSSESVAINWLWCGATLARVQNRYEIASDAYRAVDMAGDRGCGPSVFMLETSATEVIAAASDEVVTRLLACERPKPWLQPVHNKVR